MADERATTIYCKGINYYKLNKYEEAASLFQEASNLGHPDAYRVMGILYEDGKGVEKDLVEAFRWYQKAVDKGNVDAMNNLAICYVYGTGVEKNLGEAYHWYRKAAEAGNVVAMSNLGFCYEHGTGVEKNLGKAYHWYRKAAEEGDTRAMFNLAKMYEYGQGVEENLGEAYHWYQKNAESGNRTSKDADRVTEKMQIIDKDIPGDKYDAYTYVFQHFRLRFSRTLEYCGFGKSDTDEILAVYVPLPGKTWDTVDLISENQNVVGIRIKYKNGDYGHYKKMVAELRIDGERTLSYGSVNEVLFGDVHEGTEYELINDEDSVPEFMAFTQEIEKSKIKGYDLIFDTWNQGKYENFWVYRLTPWARVHLSNVYQYCLDENLEFYAFIESIEIRNSKKPY